MYEKQSRNTNRSTDTIASFLLKTYQILEHPEYQRIISWDKSGVGFIIHDVVLFTREILPKYFRHSNFSSFVRQLNMYDFHKVKQQNDILVFKNPLFCKGQQQNLKFIRRKAAKKITGQKRTHMSEKNDIENQKYQNMLKGFKKSFETEINQSSIFYEKSLQVIKDLNDSNLKKKLYIKDIFGEQQKMDTTQELKNIASQNKIQSEQIQKPKKQTIIQIPKQFLQVSQIQQSQRGICSRNQTVQKQQRKILKIDNLMLLKQEVYKSLGNYEIWLQEYIETQKKKIKYINGYRQQLIKCRETKTNENNGTQYQEAKQENQQSNSKENQLPENYEESKQNNLNYQEKKDKYLDNQSEVIQNVKNEKYFNTKQNLIPNSRMQNEVTPVKNINIGQNYVQQQNLSSQNSKNQLFQSLIQDQKSFTPRLFSAFSKSKNYEQSQQQENGQKYQFQQEFIDKKIQNNHDLRQKEKNEVEGSF